MADNCVVGGTKDERVLYWQLCNATDKAWQDYTRLQTIDAFQRYDQAKQSEQQLAAKLRVDSAIANS